MGSGSSKYNVATVQRSETGGGSEGAGTTSRVASTNITSKKSGSYKKPSDGVSPVELNSSKALHPSGPHALDFDTAVVGGGGSDDDDDLGISDLDTRSGGSGFVASGHLDAAGVVKGGDKFSSSSSGVLTRGVHDKHGVNGVKAAAKLTSPRTGDTNDSDVRTVVKDDHRHTSVNTNVSGAGNLAVAASGSGATSARVRGTGAAAASDKSNLTQGASLENSKSTGDVKLKATSNESTDSKAAKSGVKSVEAGGLGKVTDGAKSSVDDEWAHVLAKAETLGGKKSKKVNKEKEAKKEKKEKEQLAKEQKKREKEQQKLKDKEKKKGNNNKKDKGSKEKYGKKSGGVEKSKKEKSTDCDSA